MTSSLLARASGAHNLLERSGLDGFLGDLPTLGPSFALAVRSLCFSRAAQNNNTCHVRQTPTRVERWRRCAGGKAAAHTRWHW
jgi:hypothetical protein